MFYRGKHIIYGRFMFICFLKSNNTDIQGLLCSIRCLFGNESQLRILAEQWHSLCKCPLGKISLFCAVEMLKLAIFIIFLKFNFLELCGERSAR